MLLGVDCVLFVVVCFGVCCLLCLVVVCWWLVVELSLFVDRCLLLVIGCLLFVVC